MSHHDNPLQDAPRTRPEDLRASEPPTGAPETLRTTPPTLLVIGVLTWLLTVDLGINSLSGIANLMS